MGEHIVRQSAHIVIIQNMQVQVIGELNIVLIIGVMIMGSMESK